jgi:hypothetical protein
MAIFYGVNFCREQGSNGSLLKVMLSKLQMQYKMVDEMTVC